MTTGNSSQLFGGNRWITDPRQLPICQLAEDKLYVKTAINTQYNFSAANASTAFTAVALRGAQAPMVTADTYVTLLTLSGRGRVHNIILPTNTGAPYLPTAEIAVDGVVYTIAPSANLNATNRIVIGAVSPGIPSVNNGGAPIGSEVILPNAGGDYGFTSASVGGLYTPLYAGIIDPLLIESLGMPFLQFEQSCVIKFKTSLLASSAGDKIGGATYRMLA